MSTNNATNTSNPVSVAQGGTGDISFTANAVICGGTTGTGALQNVSGTGTTGQVLTSQGSGTTPIWSNPSSGGVTSLTSGTGITLTPSTITSTGSIALSTPVSIANGGTNTTSMTNTDGVVYFDGSTLNTTTVGTSGQVLTSNGTGVAPTFQAAPASGITTIDGNSGSATGSTVTISGNYNHSGTLNFQGSSPTLSLNASNFAISGFNNMILTAGLTGKTEPTRNGNTGMGWACFANGALTTGLLNHGFGYESFSSLTSGSYNLSVGADGLLFITTGSNNCSLSAYQGGINYTGAESNNISINASITTITGESNVLRIGDGTGTGSQQLNKAFVSGITGITVTGAAVLVSTGNQLGVAVSSRRYKDNIQDMNDTSVLSLRPVTFNYTVGDDHSQQIGLIAEEVHDLIPALVVLDKEGLPQTVKYHELPVYLLNEMQKMTKRIEYLENKLGMNNE